MVELRLPPPFSLKCSLLTIYLNLSSPSSTPSRLCLPSPRYTIPPFPLKKDRSPVGIHQILSNRTDTKPQIVAGHGDPEGEKRSIAQTKESESLLPLVVASPTKTPSYTSVSYMQRTQLRPLQDPSLLPWSLSLYEACYWILWATFFGVLVPSSSCSPSSPQLLWDSPGSTKLLLWVSASFFISGQRKPL